MVLIALGCVPAVQREVHQQTEYPRGPNEAGHEPTSGVTPSREAALEPAVVFARPQVADPCEGGWVRGQSGCEPCSRDEQCPISCNAETGRCAPNHWCTTDSQCGSDEVCDSGMCLHAPPEDAECNPGPIYFSWDSTTVTATNMTRLARIAACIGSTTDVLVEGHSEVLGDIDQSLALSEHRAQAVVDVLVGVGLRREQLTLISQGDLVAEGSAADRRVELFSNDFTVGERRHCNDEELDELQRAHGGI